MKKASRMLVFLGMMDLIFMHISCKHEMHDLCYKNDEITACGEMCQSKSKDEKACAQRDLLGIKQCLQENNLKSCTYMCVFSDSGKDQYCKHLHKLCNVDKNQAACNEIKESLL